MSWLYKELSDTLQCLFAPMFFKRTPKRKLSRLRNAEAFRLLNAVRTNAAVIPKRLQLKLRKPILHGCLSEKMFGNSLEPDRWFDIVRTTQMVKVFPGFDCF